MQNMYSLTYPTHYQAQNNNFVLIKLRTYCEHHVNKETGLNGSFGLLCSFGLLLRNRLL